METTLVLWCNCQIFSNLGGNYFIPPSARRQFWWLASCVSSPPSSSLPPWRRRRSAAPVYLKTIYKSLTRDIINTRTWLGVTAKSQNKQDQFSPVNERQTLITEIVKSKKNIRHLEGLRSIDINKRYTKTCKNHNKFY